MTDLASFIRQLQTMIDKSVAAADPVQKVGYLATAERMFDALCAEDGSGFQLANTGPARALIEGMRADYEAAGFYAWPGAREHLDHLTKLHTRKLDGLRKPSKRRRLR